MLRSGSFEVKLITSKMCTSSDLTDPQRMQNATASTFCVQDGYHIVSS